MAAVPATGVAQSCGGLLQPECPSAPLPPPVTFPTEPATVTLTPKRIDRNLGSGAIFVSKVKVSGQVTGPRDLSNISVRLQVRSAEYGSFIDERRTATDAEGRFSIDTLEVNVRAHVRALIVPQDQNYDHPVSGMSTNETLINVGSTHSELTFDGASRGRVLFVWRVASPGFVRQVGGSTDRAARPGPARRAYFYVAGRKARYAVRIGAGRFKKSPCPTCARPATRAFTVTRRLRRARYAYVCARSDVWLGVGTGRTDRACGRARLRVR